MGANLWQKASLHPSTIKYNGYNKLFVSKSMGANRHFSKLMGAIAPIDPPKRGPCIIRTASMFIYSIGWCARRCTLCCIYRHKLVCKCRTRTFRLEIRPQAMSIPVNNEVTSCEHELSYRPPDSCHSWEATAAPFQLPGFRPPFANWRFLNRAL